MPALGDVRVQDHKKTELREWRQQGKPLSQEGVQETVSRTVQGCSSEGALRRHAEVEGDVRVAHLVMYLTTLARMSERWRPRAWR